MIHICNKIYNNKNTLFYILGPKGQTSTICMVYFFHFKVISNLFCLNSPKAIIFILFIVRQIVFLLELFRIYYVGMTH